MHATFPIVAPTFEMEARHPALEAGGPAFCRDLPRLGRLPELAAALGGAPYHGLVSIQRVEAFSVRAGAEVVVCIPVQNEALLLRKSLLAIEAAVRAAHPLDVLVVAVVNNTTDTSATILHDWAAAAAVPTLFLDVELAAPVANVAIARRLTLDVAEALAADAVLLCTDADTTVPSDWIVRMVEAIRHGAALVAGGMTVDDAELDALPADVRRAGRVEAELTALYETIWTRLGGDGPCPLLIGAAGANMAISAAAYRAVGGLPTDAANEDRALGTAVARLGLPVTAARQTVVTTSCRLDARARHGLGDALVERCRSPDPQVDGVLVPAPTFVLRASAVALAATPDAVLRAEVAGRIGLAAAEIWAAPATAGSVAVALAEKRPEPRLTVSAAVAERAVAAAILARMPPDSEPRRAIRAALAALDR